MNIAVATTDGENVNEHFGRAKAFNIYEVSEDEFNLIMICQLDAPYSTGDKSHSFDAERFGEIAQKLILCNKLYVTKIGDAPAEAFKKMGIEPVTYNGSIRDIEIDP